MQTDSNAKFEIFEHTGYERMPYERVGSINLATGENDFGAMICAHCDEEFSGLEEIEDRTDRQWQCPCCGGWNDRKTQAA